jgi:ferredoxin
MTMSGCSSGLGNGAVTHSLCLGCGLCAKACSYGAIMMEESLMPGGQTWKNPTFDPAKCTHCGRCAVACASGTIRQEDMERLVEEALARPVRNMVFICEQQSLLMGTALQRGEVPRTMPLNAACMYPRLEELPVPPDTRLELVRGACRVSSRILYGLMRAGVRNIKVYACPAGTCPHKGRPCLAPAHVLGLADTLRQYGITGFRLELSTAVPADPGSLAQDIAEFCA